MNELWRLPTVKTATGMGRTTIYELVAQKLFPKPVQLAGRSVAWPSSEVQAWVSARIAGKSDVQIRALIKTLHAARQAGQ
jgi:prophage regulatory protein